MPKKIFLLPLFIIFFLIGSIRSVYAIEDPLAKPNNKIGIHILFTTEVPLAAKMVNTNGGDWGYVTIPIQSTDRDLRKWQAFMNNCKRYHIIPIVRLATSSDVNNTSVWRQPTHADVIDAATFLNKLSWPTKNRYVIIYNEVNRADEWGGATDPDEYARMLSFAVTVFKSKSPDFFVISAGLDNAAPNRGAEFMNQYDFMRQMNTAVPGIFFQIDGLSSHSYPNPGFSQPPNPNSLTGVASFAHERALARELTGKTLPVFITETGWASAGVSDSQKNAYYQETLTNIWNDPGIVAITPFILEAKSIDFEKFSFLTATGSATPQHTFFSTTFKIKGTPVLPPKVLAAETVKEAFNEPETVTEEETGFSFSNMIKRIFTRFN